MSKEQNVPQADILKTSVADLEVDEKPELPLLSYTAGLINNYELGDRNGPVPADATQQTATLSSSFNTSAGFEQSSHNNLSSILPGPEDAFGVPTPATTVTATGNNNIDGLLAGVKWASTSVSFSFTDSIDDYESGYPNRASHAASFQTLNATQRAAARAWIASGGEYYNVSLLNPVELTGSSDRDATIRLAESNNPPTAYAYYPNSSTVQAGDSWFNTVNYNNPVIGSYAYHTFGHELGHALGLKHGHQTGGVSNVAMNSDRDSMEFSIMTYRSYVGDPLSGGYSNEAWGYAQSLMIYDIAAIQHMYGASFGYNSGNTNYTFSTTTGEMLVNGVGQGTPGGNRIFRTIWDGNGLDTYNFSNYTTNLSLDLAPGGWSDLDVGGNFQNANLGDGNYARGHVFNALQYNSDARSLIENANGGSGNDIINGNSANNVLNGNAGNDTVNGGDGNDTVNGGDGNDLIYLGDGNDYVNIISAGNDTFYGGSGDDYIDGWTGNETYSGEAGNDTVYGNAGNDTVDGGDGNDLISGQTGNDVLRGNDGNDTVYGGAGNDTVDGGNGNDLIDLGDGNDYVNITSAGNDTFYGGSGDDYIDGYIGNETYYGQAGNDNLRGNSGNDTLTGGADKDTLTGGSGDDRFTYTALDESLLANYDVVTDYTTAEQIDAPSSVLATTLTTSTGSAANLSAAAISTVLTSGAFAVNSAKAFTVTGLSGSFIALNNAVAGFDSADDSIIFLQNYTLDAISIV